MHAGELLDRVLDLHLGRGQAQMLAQPAIGLLMDAGKNGAAKVVRAPGRVPDD